MRAMHLNKQKIKLSEQKQTRIHTKTIIPPSSSMFFVSLNISIAFSFPSTSTTFTETG
jgi:hypothetical protein